MTARGSSMQWRQSYYNFRKQISGMFEHWQELCEERKENYDAPVHMRRKSTEELNMVLSSVQNDPGTHRKSGWWAQRVKCIVTRFHNICGHEAPRVTEHIYANVLLGKVHQWKSGYNGDEKLRWIYTHNKRYWKCGDKHATRNGNSEENISMLPMCFHCHFYHFIATEWPILTHELDIHLLI